jgi:EmrB/QacA subfamily drug resistance transporter
VVTGYLLSLAVFIPVSGWAGNRFGTKRTFMFALAVFTAGSLLCATAWSIETLVLFRVVQGVGGGMLAPVSTTMLFHAFAPEERSRASAFLAVPASVAPASGPVLGGYLVEYQSWHWIFLINVPIGLLGLVAAGALLKEHREGPRTRLDVPGFVISAAGLASLLYALSQAGGRGFDDSRVVLFGLAGLALLAVFVAVELRVAQPLLDVRLYRNRLFVASNLVQVMAFAGFTGALFLLPILLQAERGLGPLESGLTTFPQAVGVLTFVPVVGRLYPIVGPRRLMLAGIVVSALTTLGFYWVELDTGLWWVRGLMFIRGWAFACMLIPLQTATFATIAPPRMGEASALFNVGRQVASSFGVALLATILTSRLAAQDAALGNPLTRDGAMLAFHDAFLAAALLTGAGIFAALLVSDREAAVTMRRRVTADEPEALQAPAH